MWKKKDPDNASRDRSLSPHLFFSESPLISLPFTRVHVVWWRTYGVYTAISFRSADGRERIPVGRPVETESRRELWFFTASSRTSRRRRRRQIKAIRCTPGNVHDHSHYTQYVYTYTFYIKASKIYVHICIQRKYATWLITRLILNVSPTRTFRGRPTSGRRFGRANVSPDANRVFPSHNNCFCFCFSVVVVVVFSISTFKIAKSNVFPAVSLCPSPDLVYLSLPHQCRVTFSSSFLTRWLSRHHSSSEVLRRISFLKTNFSK